MEISNPHDSFFKEIFSNKENASNFINSILPDALK
ncbi:MAG: Rpn family recombination-promoting nuclease/putative transposase, partial [bacterium]